MLIFGVIFTGLIILLGVGHVSTSRSLDRIRKQINHIIQDKIEVSVKEFFEDIYSDVGNVILNDKDAKVFNYFLTTVIFKDNPLRCVCVDLDGLPGYTSLFLRIAFKDIVNKHPNITFSCSDEPLLIEEIKRLKTYTWKL